MPLENVTTFEDLNEAWPLETDPIGQGNEHVQNLKIAVKDSGNRIKALEKLYYTAVRVVQYCTGDGVADDNQGLKDAWTAFLAFPSYKKRIDFSGGTYRITEETAASLFEVSDLDRLDIHFGDAKFITDHSDTSNLIYLFNLKGCNNVTADLLTLEKPTAKATSANTVYGFLIENSATRGGSGYWLKGVSGKNANGVRFAGDVTDYATNGLDSTLRPATGFIDMIKLDNTDVPDFPTYADEGSGYGITCALGGSGITVGRLDCDRIHRVFFVYGVKDVHILSGTCEDADATTINIGGYGSCVDVTVNLRLKQNVNTPMDLVKIHGHEIGVAGGASLDLDNGRQHLLSDIHLNLKLTGGGLDGHSSLVKVDKFYGDSDEAIGTDSSYSFKNISLAVQSTSAATDAEINMFTKSKQEGATGVATENIKVVDSVLPNGRVRAALLDNAQDSISIRDSKLLYFTPSPQSTSVKDVPYELDNVHGLLSVDNSSGYGAFMVLTDCVVNNRDGTVSASNCDPFNKIMYRTRLGNAYIEEKGRYDVYTNQDDSTKMYDPTGVENRLWGGAVHVEGSVQPSIATTLNIGDGAGDFTADCYVDGVIGGNFVTVDNVKNVVISVSQDNSSYGIFKGTLTAYGDGSDLTNMVVVLQIDTVFNIGSAAYATTDIAFSIDKPNRTMTFTCNNSGRFMSVAIR